MRILSLSPSSTEILYAIGAEDDIIGVTHLCDYPEPAKYKPQFGTWVHTDPERLLAERPDLIITTASLPPELAELRKSRTLVHLQPRGLAGVLETIHQLGEYTGRSEASRNVVDAMQRAFEKVRAAAPTKRLTVYCEETPDPPTIAGNWVPEIIELAGGHPIGGNHTHPSTPIHVDALHAANPDIMLFSWCGIEQPKNIETIREREGWDHLRAVHSNALVSIPQSLLHRAGPRLVEGAQQVQAALVQYQHMH